MMEQLAYKIEIDVYQGPFDVLLKAIDNDEIDIFTVSIDQITKAYFKYWQEQKPPLILASDFLFMAACLLERKSKAVLPSKEEIFIEQDVEEVENSLVDHIQEYQVYKNLAQTLRKRKEVFERVYTRHEGEKQEKEIELVNLSLQDLVVAFKTVYDQAVKRDSQATIEPEEITIEQRIDEVKKILAGKKQGVAFERIFTRGTRIEVVVTFLAILELVKLRMIKLTQDRRFGQITIFSLEEQDNGTTSGY